MRSEYHLILIHFLFIGTRAGRFQVSNTCPSGYYGSRCHTTCTYPRFGEGCRHECDCGPHLCDHVRGCPPPPIDGCPTGYTGKYCETAFLFSSIWLWMSTLLSLFQTSLRCLHRLFKESNWQVLLF
ncbi:uncharacterized protein LOC144620416 [Crassostrea virginica]